MKTIEDVMEEYARDYGYDNVEHWLEVENVSETELSDLMRRYGKELAKEAFDAGYDYRSSQDSGIIEEFGENSSDDFETFIKELK